MKSIAACMIDGSLTLKLGHMFFSSVWNPADDAAMIADVIRLARLTEAVGLDAVWLAEHHFSGQCVYAEPLTMAAAISTATERVEIGVAVVQASLRNPVRLAEQISLVDNLSRGRLITGLGYGTRFAHYEWAGYGVRPDEARARMAEVEQVMRAAWAARADAPWARHEGRYFNIQIPSIRPTPFTRPHPRLLHPATSEESIKALGRAGETFLMHMVSPAMAEQQVGWFRKGAQEAGRDEAEIRALLKQVWTWRQVFVAPTDAEAKETGLRHHRRMWMEQWANMEALNDLLGHGRRDMTEANADAMSDRLFWGSPARVADQIAHLEALGLGGVFMEFRFGGMSIEQAEANLERFAAEVAPRVRQAAGSSEPA